MENASKALVIAGGILLAIILISTFIIMWGQMKDFSNAQEKVEKEKQLASFNSEYESYHRELLRGADILSVMNKIENNNKRDPDNMISYQFTLLEDIGSLKKGTYTSNSFESTLSKDDLKTFKSVYFNGTKVEYNSKTGKVNRMEFVHKPTKEIFSNT